MSTMLKKALTDMENMSKEELFELAKELNLGINDPHTPRFKLKRAIKNNETYITALEESKLIRTKDALVEYINELLDERRKNPKEGPLEPTERYTSQVSKGIPFFQNEPNIHGYDWFEYYLVDPRNPLKYLSKNNVKELIERDLRFSSSFDRRDFYPPPKNYTNSSSDSYRPRYGYYNNDDCRCFTDRKGFTYYEGGRDSIF